jgi:hypothetical protein
VKINIVEYSRDDVRIGENQYSRDDLSEYSRDDVSKTLIFF